MRKERRPLCIVPRHAAFEDAPGGAADLADESRQALLEALHALGSALALEHRLPEPKGSKIS